MKISEIKCLMAAGMISVDDDDINHVIKHLKENGYQVTR
jgi:biotin operon repressor